jgi:2-oxoglutarate ferredoxin oxidoreductase subunit beta
VEIYQNCNIFNDGAWDPLKDADHRDSLTLRLVDGQPITLVDGTRGVVRGANGSLEITDVAEFGLDAVLVHDSHNPDPSIAFALSRLSDSLSLANTPIGVFRDVPRTSYDSAFHAQLDSAQASGRGDLATLLAGSDTWDIA